MASSPLADDLPLVQASEVYSRLASVAYGTILLLIISGRVVYASDRVTGDSLREYLSNHVQVAVESMLNKISEIDQNAVGVMEEFERSKAFALERKKDLEEERERVEKAPFTVLDLFNPRDTSFNENFAFSKK